MSAKAAEVLDAARETAARVAALRTSDRKSYLSQAAQALEEFTAQQQKLRDLASGAGPRAKHALGVGRVFRFAQHGFELAPAPDLLHQARPEFQRIE